MDLFYKISDLFWNENIWLPNNLTWKDIEPGSKKDIRYADYRDLLWPIAISFCIMLSRQLIEKYLLGPIGKSLGIKSTKLKPPVPNKSLEEAYKNSPKLNLEMISNLEKQSDYSERQIERWWRLRKGQDRPTTLAKFSQSGWRCIHYTLSFTFGMSQLWNKPWLWEFKQCFFNYPHQSIDDGIWWYYMISLGFYLSLTILQFHDRKRKDFWQMLIHHFVTLMLIGFSWICNFHRVGSLVLLVHDCADIPLEAAKCLKYANFQKACDLSSITFLVIWIVTRLGFFPRIIYSSSIEATRLMPIFPAFIVLNFMLIMLMTLHLVWTHMLMKFMISSFKAGKMETDTRSSSDGEIEPRNSARRNNKTTVKVKS